MYVRRETYCLWKENFVCVLTIRDIYQKPDRKVNLYCRIIFTGFGSPPVCIYQSVDLFGLGCLYCGLFVS